MKGLFTKLFGTVGLIVGLAWGASAQTYCTSTSQATNDSKITHVICGNIDNNTAGAGCNAGNYTHFQNMTTDMIVGSNYQMSVELSCHTGCGYDYYGKSARVWIDFTRDGDFDDAGERIGETSYNSGTFTSVINFSVPCSASPGTTRMRVVCWENVPGAIPACGTTYYGETEDYTVNIVAGATPSADFAVPDSIYTGTNATFVNNNQAGFTHQWFNSDLDPTLQSVASTATNYTYAFPSAGTYSLKLASTNCQGTAQKTKTITVVDPTSTPVANFVSSGNHFEFTGDPVEVTFFDLSMYGPTSWTWTITPDASVASWFWASGDYYSQSPSAFFYDTGTYEVCLTVDNALGSSAPLCHTAYITLQYPSGTSFENIMGQTFNSPLDSGMIYDSGGPNGNYQLNEYWNFTINPCGAEQVTLTFNTFNLENNWDYLEIYDGPDASYPMIGSYTGTNIPNPVTAESGTMTLVFISDNSQNFSGFSATWSSDVPQNGAPDADFTMPDTVYECGGGTDVFLTNNSDGVVDGQGTYNWIVDFDPNVTYPPGYCDFCAEENPVWTVPSTGQLEDYLVQMVLLTCEGNDTIVKTLVVDAPVNVPTVDFEVDNRRIAVGDEVTLTEKVLGGCDYEWVITPANGWAFVSGYDEFSRTTKVVFNGPGSYHVELRSNNPVGLGSLVRTNYIDVIDYCNPSVALPTIADVGISNVKINGIDNTSATGVAPGYSDYSEDFSTTLIAGQTYDIEVSRTSTVNPMNRKAWIDFNRDGIFQDPAELVMMEASASTLSYTATFTVPDYTYTLEGKSRLRVGVTMGSSTNNPCGPAQVGEYEDYGIVLEYDSQKPVITLNDDDSIYIEVGNAYVEYGAMAMDNLEGDISNRIVITNLVNTAQTGIYYVTYEVTDGSGLAATPVVRTVIVSEDLTAPVITLVGGSPVQHNVLVPYVDLGYSAIDDPGAVNVTADVTVFGTVDVNNIGDYPLLYEVYDINGNYASVTRLVQVRDIEAPVITSPARVNWQVGTPFVNPVTITDNFDPNFQSSYTGNIDVEIFGEYPVTFYAEDASGNQATPVTVIFEVGDWIAPVIQTLQGSDVITVEVNDVDFFEPPVTAIDNYYPNVSIDRDATGFDIYELGSYPIVYTATDGSLNTATYTRTINVVDTERPVVIAPPLNVQRWGTFDAMQGVIAVDNYWSPSWFDSNNKIEIIVNNVDINYPGLYNIVYRATDGSGNKSELTTRVVNVVTPTSLNEVDLESKVLVYPNPSQGMVNVKLDAGVVENANIVVVDMLGNIVVRVATDAIVNGEVAINLGNVSAGVYMVQVNTHGGTVTKKIVINK